METVEHEFTKTLKIGTNNFSLIEVAREQGVKLNKIVAADIVIADGTDQGEEKVLKLDVMFIKQTDRLRWSINLSAGTLAVVSLSFKPVEVIIKATVEK